MASLRKISAHNDGLALTSSVHEILKLHHFYSYRPTNVQALHKEDFRKSVFFSNFALEKYIGLLDHILWFYGQMNLCSISRQKLNVLQVQSG